MNVIDAVDTIRRKFQQSGAAVQIPLLKAGTFTAEMVVEGVRVDNLGSQPLLPWAEFQEAVCALIRNGGRAERGDAMASKLGAEGLSLDSVEGHIALVVYDKRPGDAVFRRITPVACILIWAGLCKAEPNELVLL